MGRHRIPVVIALDDLIGELEEKPTKLRQARALILEALDPKPAVKPAAKSIAPGSVPARILEVLGESDEPVKSQQLAKDVKVSYFTVLSHLSDLADAGRVLIVGAGRTRCYALPTKKGGKK